MAFCIYDMNSDGLICEYDLFSLIKSAENKLFIETIQQDFKDIKSKMSEKARDQEFHAKSENDNNHT